VAVSDDELAHNQDFWRTHDEQGRSVPDVGKIDERLFTGSLGAAAFIPQVDAPFRLDDVPDFKDKDRNKVKDKLWDFYHKAALPDVIGKDPSSGEEQLQLRYLNLVEQHKNAYNSLVLPFWNAAAPKVWQESSAAILNSLKLAVSDPAKQRAYADNIALYVSKIMDLKKPLDDALQELITRKDEINELLRAHPKLVAAHANIARGLRLDVSYPWQAEINDHLQEAQNMTNLAQPNKIGLLTPPFVKPPALEPLD
jgi:hypothetical protein